MTQPAHSLPDMAWSEGPLLGFDFETTGVDPRRDLPVQVALVRWQPRGPIRRTVLLVDPGCDIPAAAEAIHGISTRRAHREGCPLEEAAGVVHAVLTKARAEKVPLVAMNASFDVTIAVTLFRRFGYRPIEWDALVDPLVIDREKDPYRSGKRRLEALCRTYGVVLTAPHDAANDADAAVAVVRTMAVRYPEIAGFEIGELTRLEARWHRAWAFEYDAWCRSNARPGLAPGDFSWPERVAPDPHLAA